MVLIQDYNINVMSISCASFVILLLIVEILFFLVYIFSYTFSTWHDELQIKTFIDKLKNDLSATPKEEKTLFHVQNLIYVPLIYIQILIAWTGENISKNFMYDNF